MKKCSKCGKEKELNEFNKHKAKKDGVRSYCRNCSKEYRENNKEKMKIYIKEYYSNNKEKIKKYKKEYNEKNPEYYKEYGINNKEKIKEKKKIYGKVYREENKEKLKKYKKEYIQNNPEYYKEYRENNKERINEKRREHDKKRIKYDPEYRRLKNIRSSNNYHLNKSQTKDKSSSSELIKLFDIQNYECIYCKIDISESKHIDHLIPLSKGGSNLVTNLALACPDCNLRKSNKNLYQFLEEENIDYNEFVIKLGERNDKYFREY